MFTRWLLHRAARTYAVRLPHQLTLDYGHEEFYTEPQIRNAIADAGLNFRYAVLGYARYLTAEHFHHLRIKLDVVMDYEAARALFVAYEPYRVYSGSDTPDRGMFGLRRYM